jgi:prephenate dehydrogenase
MKEKRMTMLFNKVVIIGVGLIGGSLGLAGKENGLFGEVVGVGRNKANLETALKMGAVDRYRHDPVVACSDADLIVLATPVERMLAIGKEVAPHLRKGACLTDVGSVKEALVNGLEGIVPRGVRFVGGHPIAGSEESGASAATSDLFEGSRTILTPTPSTDPEALRDLRSLWEGVGSTVLEMDAAEHDSLLAAVSHLPHMVAYALVSTLVEMQDERPDISSFAAGGFKDITRIASSHPEMWAEICQMNRQEIVEMIERYDAVLKRIKDQIKAGNFEALTRTFEKARQFRDKC